MRPPFHPASAVKAWLAGENGAVTILVVVFFATLIAFIGLIVDVGRIMNVHSQAGSYVDRVALAAAAELNRESDALDRAVRAAVGDDTADPIIDSGFRMTLSGDSAVEVQRLTFLSAIAEDPEDPYARSPVPGDTVLCKWTADAGFECEEGFSKTTASAVAEFVLVDATTETEEYLLFPVAAMIEPGLRTEASVAPQAIAGFKQQFCNLPPLSICNPQESQTSPYGGDFTAVPGQQILMKTKGSGSSWAPGDFGLLAAAPGSGAPHCKDPPKEGSESNSASLIRCVLGLVDPNTQCVDGSVDIRPGQANSVHKGLNVRFDIWDSPLSKVKDNAAFAPSANVTKGKVWGPGQCTANKLEDPPATALTEALPRDSCFASNSCGATTDGTRRFGNGVTTAQLTDYWDANHGGALPGSLTGGTRYDVYRYEIDNNMIPNKSSEAPDPGENGNPTCSSQPGVNNPDRDRRTFVMAVINCLQHDVRGSQDNVPVVKLVRMFFTEPIGLDGASEDDLWAEVIEEIEPGNDDGVLKQFPVLYR